MQGSVSVKGLRTEGRIDVREADVDVVVDRAAPLAIYSEGGDSVDLTPPDGGYQLDAVAMNAERDRRRRCGAGRQDRRGTPRHRRSQRRRADDHDPDGARLHHGTGEMTLNSQPSNS